MGLQDSSMPTGSEVCNTEPVAWFAVGLVRWPLTAVCSLCNIDVPAPTGGVS